MRDTDKIHNYGLQKRIKRCMNRISIRIHKSIDAIMKKRKKEPNISILLYPHGGSKNHGCEAIVRATIKNIGLSRNQVTLYSKNPEEDYEYGIDPLCYIHSELGAIKKYSLKYFYTGIFIRIFNNYNPFWREYYRHFIQVCKGKNLALSIGGDNYCYDGYQEKLALMNKYANKSGTKTVLWCCSIEPGLLNDKKIVKDLNKYILIIARESITYNALIAKGISTMIKLMPDPAFLLDKIELPLPKGFYEYNTIGINISPAIQSLDNGNNISYQNYSKLLQYIITTTNMQVALIPHVTWPASNDMDPLMQLFNEFRHTERVVLLEGCYNCMELKGFISRCRMFIGARTHATIAAYSTCVPTLVVGYSVKAIGIARDIFGSEKDMVIPIKSLKKDDDLINAFKVLQEKEDKLRGYLEKNMPLYREKAWFVGEEIRKLLQDNRNQ